MDPITQGLLGAAAAQATVTKWLGKRTWFYGAVGGMAADLDIFIRSSEDPLVAWTYHRHFTHSLAFIPIGGLITALPFLLLPHNRPRAKLIIATTTIGYATHALLDAFTSYGTMLAWPFSMARTAWDVVSVIDPMYTIALGVGVVWAALRGKASPAVWGLVASSIYLALCGVQNLRARDEMTALAERRGHDIERMRVMPSLLSNILWRSVYETEGKLVIDLVRVPWFGEATVYEGSEAPLLTAASLPVRVRESSELLGAFETFHWFADGWVAAVHEDPFVVGDLRYGTTVQRPVAMWGVQLEPTATPAIERWTGSRDTRQFMQRSWAQLRGEIVPPEAQ